MQQDTRSTLDVIYENWRGYNGKLQKCVAPLVIRRGILCRALSPTVRHRLSATLGRALSPTVRHPLSPTLSRLTN